MGRLLAVVFAAGCGGADRAGRPIQAQIRSRDAATLSGRIVDGPRERRRQHVADGGPTTALMADRSRVSSGIPIPPDEAVSGEAEMVQRAIAWLRAE